MSEDPVAAAAHPYQYFVLRAVPRVEREEFVNVGVVVWCQAADLLRAAWHVDPDRLRAVDPRVDLDALTGMLRVVDDVCAGVTGAGRPSFARVGMRFGWLAAPRSTVLQPSPVHGGVCADPERELDRLLDRLVRLPD